MLCQFEKLLYPKDPRSVAPSDYMIALYRPCETVLDSAGKQLGQIKVVGVCLPTAMHIRYDMDGRWERNPQYGLQFALTGYREVLIPNWESIVAYLSSGQIQGIGPAIAERIYDRFGDRTLEVLDRDPQRLLEISGIGEVGFKRILESYLANRGARDVVAFLTPFGITAKRAVQIYQAYGKQAIQTVQEHPYRLCEMAGVGFHTADRIAMRMGLDRLAPERIDQGLLYALTEAESRGHLCLTKQSFLDAAIKLLDTPTLPRKLAADRAAELLRDGQLAVYGDMVYRAKTAKAEQHLADRVSARLRNRLPDSDEAMDDDLAAEEQLLKLKLAPEQKAAVRAALQNRLVIITGGPGTGKTLIQKVILDIYRKRHPSATVCACAPTGRAARRMEQSTGVPASTVHRALGLYAGADGDYGEPEPLDADLILIDEVSMLDIRLACDLFNAAKPDARMILVGDADQLPSVGPGAVLSELIASGCVPTVCLDKVFRQSAGSRIATNAKLIRHGNLALEYGTDFQFLESSDLTASADRLAELYVRDVSVYGIDNVALLTPYRQKTETGANALNLRLRELVNPADPTKMELRCGSRVFREGDKVMQIKNHADISNGDIGYIRSITVNGAEGQVNVDFGDGRLRAYEVSDMELLDFGYATTVHKSQGSEYQSVLINLQAAHSVMLTRPLIYTAITRGKRKVTIVGERRALCISIRKTDTEKRGTCLAKRIQEQL